MAHGPQPILRVLVASLALAATTAAPAAATAAQTAHPIQVMPVSRYLAGADLDDPGDATKALGATALVPVDVTLPDTRCPSESRWRIDGELYRPRLRYVQEIGCRFRLDLAAKAKHRVDVRILDGSPPTTRAFTLDDQLIVALGDSVASGEGNPAPTDPRWASRRCHRSPVAGVEQAARVLGAATSARPAGQHYEKLPSVTFVNLACSGATIAHGLIRDYRGIEHPAGAPRIPSQIDRVSALIRKPDVVLVSVGANDIHFGDVVRLCIALPECPQRRFDPDHLGKGTTADVAVGAALARLRDQYDALGKKLNHLAPAANRVFITEYFDPTRGKSGATCHALVKGAISRAELEWAENSVLAPLNDQVAAAVQRNGWQEVGGIATAFSTHGYCTSKTQRWIVKVEESLANLAGPLHPNALGQRAIADAIVPQVGGALGLVVTPRVEPPGKRDFPWKWIAIGAGVAVVLLVIVAVSSGAIRATLSRFCRRLWYLLRPAPGPRAAKDYKRPEVPRLRDPDASPTSQFVTVLIKAGGALASTVVSVGFVVVVGAAIVWVRFWAARYPADQAVDAVSREELLVIGAQALVLFVVLGTVAVAAMWLLDPRGTPGRRMRVALAVLVFAELAAAVIVGSFGRWQLGTLVIGFAVASALLVFLFETLRSVALRMHRWTPRKAGRYMHGRFFVPGEEQRGSRVRVLIIGLVVIAVGVGVALLVTDVLESDHPWRWLVPPVAAAIVVLLLWVFTTFMLQLLAVVALAVALVCAPLARHADNRAAFVLAPIFLAYLLFAIPRPPWRAGIKQPRGAGRDPYINAARAALAVTLFVSLAIFLLTDEAWLGLSALAAVALAGLCLAIAWASGNRFIPFAVTVFFSVCVFGAVLACLRTVDSPQAQPVAILLKEGDPVCGVWVGESSGRVWYARLRLSELASTRRPVPRDSSLTSVARADIDDMALGPLQPVGRAQDQAAALRSALLREHGRSPDAGARCGPLAPPHQKVAHTPERALAKSVQPELVVDRKDGFWPVSVLTLLRMQDRRARVCRRVGDGICVRMITQSDFSFGGGEGEWLDYPANELSRRDERRLFHEALGSVDPSRTARVYFLVSRGKGKNAPDTVQFWFFYTYNYLLTAHFLKFPAGVHEGDFETVSLLLSARSHQPHYVWMARHEDEGRMFVWDEDQLKKSGGHLVAYAARGSHATYESCRRQSRAIKAPLGLIDDRPQCDIHQELHLAPESTHLIDLSRVPWACWHGRFGEHPGGRFLEHIPHEADDGPLGPLWQQTFGNVRSEPCSGVHDSDNREVDGSRAPGEEVLSDKVSARLRAGAGRLDPAVDTCSDWEHAPSAGAFLLACDQAELTRYLKSGLELPSSTGLRIDVAGRAARPGPITVPAVRRDPREPTLGNWRITATRLTHATIYAACQANKGYLEALFPAVDIRANEALRVDERDRSTWRLRNARGEPVATAEPHAIKKPSDRRPAVCGL
jgi:lysophospholipase L1-like esterase